MIKKSLFFVLGLSLWIFSSAFSQGFNAFDAQYLYKRFMFNPSYAGSVENAVDTWMSLRTSQMNMDGRPTFFALSIDAPFMKQTGIGINIEHSTTGSFLRNRFSAGYSYGLRVKNQEIFLGISVGMFSEKIDQSKVGSDDLQTLQIISSYPTEVTVFDAGFGASYLNQGLELGLSFPSLKKGSFRVSGSVLEKPLMLMNASYNFFFQREEGLHMLSPLITFLNYHSYQSQLLLGGEYSFQQRLCFYALYNPVNNGISGGMSFKKDQKYSIMMGYSANMGQVASNFGGSIEFGFGFLIPYENVRKEYNDYFGL